MTLNALTWATNANYSTGPDVGTPTKVDPSSSPNGFISGTIAAPQHVNYLVSAIAAQLLKAVDGAGGGTYTLTAPLVFAGQKLQLTADLDLDGDVDLDASSTFTSHGTITVDNAVVNLDDGSLLNVLDGASIAPKSGSSCIFESGSLLRLSAGTVFDIDSNVDLAASATFTSHGTIIVDNGVVRLDPGSVLTVKDGASIVVEDADGLVIDEFTETFRLTLTAVGAANGWSVPAIGTGKLVWEQTDVSAQRNVPPIPLPIRPGDSLVELSIKLNGENGHGALPATMPKCEIIRVDSSGSIITLATTTDGSATVPDYEAEHFITMASGSLDSGAMPILATIAPLYVVVYGEYGPGTAIAGLELVTITGTVIGRSYRGAQAVYS